MTLRSLSLGVALLMVGGVTASADTISSGGSWVSWNASMLGTASNPTYGGAYWNNLSGDGPTNNVGWCLTGGGGCTMANPPGALSYYASGTAPMTNMSFSSTGSTVTVSLQGVFTAETSTAVGIDYFGYYLLNSSGQVTSQTELFSAADPTSTTRTFTVSPNQSYGFYLENVQGQGTQFETDFLFYMNSSQDSVSVPGVSLTPLQHAAVFEDGSSYFVGMEDAIMGVGDDDYNDMIVQVSATSTPEPVSAALSGIGLVGLGLLARRRNRAN